MLEHRRIASKFSSHLVPFNFQTVGTTFEAPWKWTSTRAIRFWVLVGSKRDFNLGKLQKQQPSKRPADIDHNSLPTLKCLENGLKFEYVRRMITYGKLCENCEDVLAFERSSWSGGDHNWAFAMRSPRSCSVGLWCPCIGLHTLVY